MISTFLVEHPWLTTTALVGFVLLGPPVGAWLVGRPTTTRVLAGLAALAVGLSTLLPTGRALERGCEVAWTWPTLGKVELMGNVVLFVPLVLLLGVALGRPLAALLTGTTLSALIETGQALLPAIGRSCATTDWEANTLGSLLGALLAVAALRLARAIRR